MMASLVRVTRDKKELDAWQQLSRVTTAKKMIFGYHSSLDIMSTVAY
jgi:hypothetical protein